MPALASASANGVANGSAKGLKAAKDVDSAGLHLTEAACLSECTLDSLGPLLSMDLYVPGQLCALLSWTGSKL